MVRRKTKLYCGGNEKEKGLEVLVVSCDHYGPVSAQERKKTNPLKLHDTSMDKLIRMIPFVLLDICVVVGA
jgi:hypothetical protein